MVFDSTTVKDMYAFKSALRHTLSTAMTPLNFASTLPIDNEADKQRLKKFHTVLMEETGLQNIYDSDSFTLSKAEDGSWQLEKPKEEVVPEAAKEEPKEEVAQQKKADELPLAA
jgi:hypothetical protein